MLIKSYYWAQVNTKFIVFFTKQQQFYPEPAVLCFLQDPYVLTGENLTEAGKGSFYGFQLEGPSLVVNQEYLTRVEVNSGIMICTIITVPKSKVNITHEHIKV